MTEWDISPFEADGLTVAPLQPPVLPEPARHGENPSDCGSCRRRDEGLWLDEHRRLSRRDGVGVPLALMLHPRDHYDLADLPDARAAELGVLTKHLAGHLEALPPYPETLAEADAHAVVDALIGSYGGRRPTSG